MCAITHSHVYCPFPKATLVDFVSLALFSARSASAAKALDKYRERGWDTLPVPIDKLSASRVARSFPPGVRSFGDDSSWVLPVDNSPPNTHNKDLEKTLWTLRTDGGGFIAIERKGYSPRAF